MKNELLLSAAILPMCGMAGEAIAASPAKGAPKEKQRPNIVLFLVDDMGWQDTSLPFWTQRTHYNDTYHTPNMERLAAQGKMFTQAYACSISSPHPGQSFYRDECRAASCDKLDITQKYNA